MAKKNNKNLSVEEGHIVVKNKKFKITDLVMFAVCVVAALAIWLYATGAEQRKTEKIEELQENLQQQVQKA